MQSHIIKNIINHSTSNIDKYFTEQCSKKTPLQQLLTEHGIWGLVDSDTSLIAHKKKEAKIANIFFNEHFLSFKKLLSANGFKHIIPIKGISLLKQIYPQWDQRRMSDIDVYIPTKNKNLLHNILTRKGYQLLDEKKWKANKHKTTYLLKNNFIDITIEIHYKLYSHTDYAPTVKNSDISLSKTDELLYLCYHLAEQHNFIKLFWLKDIALYVSKYDINIDWEMFHRLAKKINIERSTESCLLLVNKYLNAPARYKKTNFFTDKFINWNFLCFPYRLKVKYLIVKYYLKGPRAFSYFFNWLKVNQPRFRFNVFKK